MGEVVMNCVDWASSTSSSQKEDKKPKTSALSSNWIARSINEESFRMHIELAKLKSYVSKLSSIDASKEDVETLEIKASKLLDTWRDYVYKILYDVYRVYVDNMKRGSVGDKGLLMGYINVSVKKYLSKVGFKVYKGSIYDLQIMGVYLEVDPIEDVELVLDKEHPMALEYQRDMDMVRGIKGVKEEDTPKLHHPFYKETSARSSLGKEEEFDVVDLSPGESIHKRGDVFEPLRIEIPKILWVNKIDWELWGYLIQMKKIKMYKDY